MLLFLKLGLSKILTTVKYSIVLKFLNIFTSVKYIYILTVIIYSVVFQISYKFKKIKYSADLKCVLIAEHFDSCHMENNF